MIYLARVVERNVVDSVAQPVIHSLSVLPCQITDSNMLWSAQGRHMLLCHHPFCFGLARSGLQRSRCCWVCSSGMVGHVENAVGLNGI